MKKLSLFAVGATLALMLFVAPGGDAQAATPNADLLKQIQALQEQIKTLQAKLLDLRGNQASLQAEIKANLKEGMTDEDIKKIQEILASDPELYPKGLITGYYGPLTKEAIKRFQARFGITASGDIDEDTREHFEEWFKEGQNGRFPMGLLRMQDRWKAIEMRLLDRCEKNGRAGLFLCKRLHDKYGHGSVPATSTNSTIIKKIDVIFHEDEDEAHVTVTYKAGNKKTFTYDTTDEDEVIDELADDLNIAASKIEDIIKFKTEHSEENIDEIRVTFDGDEADVEVEYEDGDVDEFTVDADDEDEAITAIADELDIDEDDVEDLVTFEDGDGNEDIDYIRVEFSGDTSEVGVKYDGGATKDFNLGTTLHNEVIEGIADELDIDEDDVRDIVEFLDGHLSIDVRIDDGDAEVDVTYEDGTSLGFTLHTEDEDEIVDEIADRTDLTTDEIEEVIEFDHAN